MGRVTRRKLAPRVPTTGRTDGRTLRHRTLCIRSPRPFLCYSLHVHADPSSKESNRMRNTLSVTNLFTVYTAEVDEMKAETKQYRTLNSTWSSLLHKLRLSLWFMMSSWLNSAMCVCVYGVRLHPTWWWRHGQLRNVGLQLCTLTL